MLNDELFYRNDAESIEYLNFNTVYFNVTKVVQVIRKDAWENFLNCDSVKRKYMYKLEEFCKVLCRLSGFCNVYHIKEIVTTFINSNIENMYKPDSNSKLQVTIVSPDAESQTNKAT